MDKHVPSCIRGIRLRGRNIRRNGRERSNAVCPQTELAKTDSGSGQSNRAISLAKAAAADSWQSVIFVETKAQRYIGNEVAFDELMSIYTTWKSFPPSEREYPPQLR